jgi:putative ABC transport system permease protein
MAFALLIGVSLISFVSVLSTSTKAYAVAEAGRMADVQAYTPRAIPPDQAAPIDPALAERIRRLPEVSATASISTTSGKADGAAVNVGATNPAALLDVRDVETTAGNVRTLAAGQVAVSQNIATARHWRLGSHVSVSLPSSGRQTLRVGAIYADSHYVAGLPDLLLTRPDYERLGGKAAVSELHLQAAREVPVTELRTAVERVATGSELLVKSREQEREYALGQIGGSTAMYLALSGLAALVGLSGVTSTIALSIFERTREIGLLRAVGMERDQIRSMVRTEATIVTLVGAVLGVGIGAYFGWAAARALEHSSAPTLFTVPVLSLAVIVLIAVLAGVGSAVLPARWAGRIDVMRAVAAD